MSDGSEIPLNPVQDEVVHGNATVELSTIDREMIGTHELRMHGVQNAEDSGLGFSFSQEVFFGPFEVIVTDPCEAID